MEKKTETLLVTIKQILIKDKTTWPIIIFAVSRNPKVTGRNTVLKNSIIVMKDANHKGDPRGRNWAKNLKGWKVLLDITIANQIIQAAVKEKIVWTVDGKKYGFILKILRKRIVKNSTVMKDAINFK